ncbi:MULTISPECIES: siroheme synthase CysG [unclassified Salinivibrio]|uniref:siroheme synthase CysG n=1 Tax=unclassified Salinivibrio TaxID=2636825 RepID=UPI000985A9E2|nr:MULTISPECIES: siroheme synthase CysG [unclassified Salinivibrio]OOE91600.1 uroporphyrinogen-III C-methyltransferase [Salinivibrio sp. AR640]OOF07778.1 uroporphyrinogen-III C-methyltransferase [Salinivibrio sp. MA440]
MDYLPLFAQLKHRPCLVVGGGEVAWRKTRMLLKVGAAVTLVAPEVDREIEEAQAQGKLTVLREAFRPDHLDGNMLAIAATDNALVNELVSTAADSRNILVNVVDDTPKCSFIVPSLVDRSPIIIAISSGGKAPVLARMLREKIETLVPQHIGKMAAMAGAFRDKLKARIPTLTGRRKFWEAAFSGRFADLVAAGKHQQAEQALEQLSGQITTQGEVALIGAGPGDPGLLTLRALQLMQQADVVLYDYLVAEPIMELCRRDAELVCVGKRASYHSVSQDDINRLLVEHAQAGKRVVRLKGGDPFMFGRGGEELQTLANAGVSFQVVPGITAAAGATAYAGIPLTHRDHAQTALFITGHLKKEQDTLEWATLARAQQTLVIYMGLMKSAHIQSQLLAHGRSPETPVAVIENGTRPEQKVFTGQLNNLPSLAEQAASPALIVVGEVAALAGQLTWFGDNNVATDADPTQAPTAVVNFA